MFFFSRVQIGSRTFHPVFKYVRGLFPRYKAAETWGWPLTTIYYWDWDYLKLNFYSHVQPHSVVLSWAQRKNCLYFTHKIRTRVVNMVLRQRFKFIFGEFSVRISVGKRLIQLRISVVFFQANPRVHLWAWDCSFQILSNSLFMKHRII
jgi:hypothetical protein